MPRGRTLTHSRRRRGHTRSCSTPWCAGRCRPALVLPLGRGRSRARDAPRWRESRQGTPAGTADTACAGPSNDARPARRAASAALFLARSFPLHIRSPSPPKGLCKCSSVHDRLIHCSKRMSACPHRGLSASRGRCLPLGVVTFASLCILN